MATSIHHEFSIPREFSRQRLDQVLAEMLPEYSRARLQHWINSGHLTVDGKPGRPKDKLLGGEVITLDVEEQASEDGAEKIPIDIVCRDKDFFVVNKPAGMVVHPGAGNPSGTLLNALLNADENLANIPRAGIVHRLDKDTSGLMVVARSLEAQNYLVRKIQQREVTRIYEALVYGVLRQPRGSIEAAIGRHPVQRKKMAIRNDGKAATTHYRLKDQFDHVAHIECRLESGRTHQIRVHMQSAGLPLVGDPTYGGTYRRPRNGNTSLENSLKSFGRQALHARRLEFAHPSSGEWLKFKVPLPDDLIQLLDLLRGD